MPQSLSQVYLHVAWSTKGRSPVLTPAVRALLFPYLSGVFENLGTPSLIIGGVEDHVHCLCRMSRTLAIAEMVGRAKESSCKWLTSNGRVPGDFRWQGGYGAFSISPSHVNATSSYIAHQEAHHRVTSFQEEYRRLLQKYGIPIREEFLWD